jgi:hypothetical protein
LNAPGGDLPHKTPWRRAEDEINIPFTPGNYDFSKDEGTYETTQAVAIKRVLAWQIEKAAKKRHLSPGRSTT